MYHTARSSLCTSLTRRTLVSTRPHPIPRQTRRFSSQGPSPVQGLHDDPAHDDDDTQAGERLARLKHPARGGQNLSSRYERLERSLRGKEEYRRDIEAYAPRDASTPEEAAPAARKTRAAPRMFAGFVLPEEPQPPQPDECCMSGCAVCVHDLYAESLAAYDAAVAELRVALAGAHVPEAAWPAEIRVEKERKKDAVLSAFEQMELQLAARREAGG
ncbi:hypothetical protein DFH11DRAFT_1583515 [Phellopilus nigrolimitatus]|nr:hypothetical protein DFH11DRAFT_1583515 [Phellopilus nigrolimitatus]